MPALNPNRQVVNENFNLVVAININRLRTEREMTLTELAEAADMDPTVLNRVELQARAIKFREAIEIAKCLGVSVERLYKKHNGVSYEWA